MFGYTIIRSEALDSLHTRIASLEDCRLLLLRDIQSREEEIVSTTVELNDIKQRLAKVKTEHDALVGLCYDPTSAESSRAGGFSVRATQADEALPLASVPDATGHSSE